MAIKNFHENYKKQVLRLADEMRNQPMPELTEELFALFETTGNRLKYEEVYFGRRKFLAVYGMAAIMFGRAEDFAKLEEILLSVCEEECWALPAHVNRKDDPHWQTTVDLFASETAQALAEIVALVNSGKDDDTNTDSRNKLADQICERVHQEIERRVFTSFFSSKPNYGCWECAGHNWNAVCAGSIGSAAIYLMAGKEEERLQKCLERLCNSLKYYLNGFEEDGACMEGIGYFTYGMTYFVGFAEQLYRYTNGKIDLFADEKLKKIARFQQKMYCQCGQTISFSDGEMQAKFRMGLTRFLAEKYDGVAVPNEVLAADFETDTCYRFMGLCRDYLWTKEGAKKKAAESVTENGGQGLHTFQPRHDILPVAQWSICESINGVGMAVKGGHNAESHNHNDVGSFLYLVNGEQLITDLGAGEYTKDYFGEGRYEILCNSSMGHSVPLPNGKTQQSGEWHRATEFTADGKGKTKINFSAAYPIGNIRHLERETQFSMEDGSLVVTDTFEMPLRSGRFIEQVVTQGEVKVEWNPEGESVVKIQKGNAACLITFPKEIHHLYCMEMEHSNHAGEKETVRLIRWDAFFKRGEKTETWFKITPVM